MINNCCFFATSAYDHREHKHVYTAQEVGAASRAFSYRNMRTASAEITVFWSTVQVSPFLEDAVLGNFILRSFGRISLLKDKFTAAAAVMRELMRAFARERGFNKRLWTSNFARSLIYSHGNYRQTHLNNVVTPKLLVVRSWKLISLVIWAEIDDNLCLFMFALYGTR